MAQLRGKLPTEIWQNSEDLLTSAVLGTLKNLPTKLATEVLARATPLSGSAGPSLTTALSWAFWPSWPSCEPDVVIEDRDNVVVIEAKLYADFGRDEGTGTQLTREWLDGWAYSQKTGKRLWLVALTNHGSIPKMMIRQQLAGIEVDFAQVCWLSWFDVGRVLRQAGSGETDCWCSDLLDLLSRIGLAPFNGFAELLEELKSIPLDSLPWVTKRVLNVDRKLPAGFEEGVAIARQIALRGIPQWHFPQHASQVGLA